MCAEWQALTLQTYASTWCGSCYYMLHCFFVTCIGSNEEQLFKLADTIDKDFRKHKKQTPKETKCKPIKRKILDEFETDNEEVIIHSGI